MVRLAFAIILLSAFPAQAADGPETTVKLSFGDTGNRELRAQTTFKIGGAAELAGRLELGQTEFDNSTATYASAGLNFRRTSVDIGIPRSVFEVGPLRDRPQFNASAARQTFRPLAAEAAFEGSLGPGIRILTEAGGLRLGTSIHQLRTSGDDVLGLVGNYDASEFPGLAGVSIYGGAETDGTDERFRLGTEIARGRTYAAFDHIRSRDEGLSVSQVSVGLSLSDSWMVGVAGSRELTETNPIATNRFGIGAAFTASSGTYLRGGLDRSENEDVAFDVEIGFEF